MQPDLISLPQKQDVLGVGISKTSYSEVAELCVIWCQQRQTISSSMQARYICITSVHGIIAAQNDPELRVILNNADIATPDGMPVVWAIRSFGHKAQQRVYGPTLMLDICRRAALTEMKVFLYGGRDDETITALRERLGSLAPGLQIVGSYVPPFRPLTFEEDAEVVSKITSSRADIVFIGVSTPKQERWMYSHRFSLSGITMIGVGAGFDFHAGRTKQAPSWMQSNGLEWLFRLSVEPARLWRRYLLVTPRFLPMWAMQLMRSGARHRGQLRSGTTIMTKR